MRHSILAMAALASVSFPADWSRFRGPNGSGVGDATHLPTEFGPEKNVVWKTQVPLGFSSPVIGGDLIFLTGAEGGALKDIGKMGVIDEGGKLYTIAVD
jgi:hypothetical protein